MIHFGTGGWRAVIGDGFIRTNIELLAAAMCEKIIREGVEDKPVILGYDRRFLSKEAMQWCGSVFAARGIVTKLVNRAAPTPLIMFYVDKYKLPYGLMITASHNPAVYNGIKVFTAGGRDASSEQTGEIERIAETIDAAAIPKVEYQEAVRQNLIEEIYPLNEYLDDIIGKIDIRAIRDANLRVAFDPMYGVSEVPLKTLLLTARCDIFSIHDSHDTLFGGKMPAPSERTLRYLIAMVMDYPFDIGIATDGDADRLGVIDDAGRYLSPNDVLVLLYYYMVKYKGWNGPVVRNVSTTHLLDRIAERFGQQCYEVPVGFKHVSAKMQEVDAVLGGESSGGLTVRGHLHGKDGIYAAMLLIEMIAVTKKKLSVLYREIEETCGKIFMEERSCRVRPGCYEKLMPLLSDEQNLPRLPYEIDHISHLDGCKVWLKCGGWVNVRFSGTEPLIRICSEMRTKEEAAGLCDIFEKHLSLDRDN